MAMISNRTTILVSLTLVCGTLAAAYILAPRTGRWQPCGPDGRYRMDTSDGTVWEWNDLKAAPKRIKSAEEQRRDNAEAHYYIAEAERKFNSHEEWLGRAIAKAKAAGRNYGQMRPDDFDGPDPLTGKIETAPVNVGAGVDIKAVILKSGERIDIDSGQFVEVTAVNGQIVTFANGKMIDFTNVDGWLGNWEN